MEFSDGRVSDFRYKVHDHIAERFAHAFSDTIGEWCEKNNIALCGHAMNEPSLSSQNLYVTDCMRLYRGFQLPGIDMLADLREFTTAKQAASATHQYGREGVLSELYGVTNYTFVDKLIGKTLCVSNQLGYVFAREHQSFDRGKILDL